MGAVLEGGDQLLCLLGGGCDEFLEIFIVVKELGIFDLFDFEAFRVESFLFELLLIDLFLLFGLL